uniref:Secreted protein n=1 Tax=Plectus sambesii TaxID=2011161 RepID=A0A914WLK7_9BILA
MALRRGVFSFVGGVVCVVVVVARETATLLRRSFDTAPTLCPNCAAADAPRKRAKSTRPSFCPIGGRKRALDCPSASDRILSQHYGHFRVAIGQEEPFV